MHCDFGCEIEYYHLFLFYSLLMSQEECPPDEDGEDGAAENETEDDMPDFSDEEALPVSFSSSVIEFVQCPLFLSLNYFLSVVFRFGLV